MNDRARNNRVVVGVLDVEGVIAIPEARAIELAAIHRALATASTWGELCSALSERSLGELTRLMDDELPSKDAVFELEQIGAYFDGDWPGWPQQEMLDWMPTRVRTLGTVEQSMLNGPGLSIPQQRLHQVIEGLAMAGFNVRRDDNLVSAASGYV
jgi:hypothetical protein